MTLLYFTKRKGKLLFAYNHNLIVKIFDSKWLNNVDMKFDWVFKGKRFFAPTVRLRVKNI
jgi:hypothetical protein